MVQREILSELVPNMSLQGERDRGPYVSIQMSDEFPFQHFHSSVLSRNVLTPRISQQVEWRNCILQGRPTFLDCSSISNTTAPLAITSCTLHSRSSSRSLTRFSLSFQDNFPQCAVSTRAVSEHGPQQVAQTSPWSGLFSLLQSYMQLTLDVVGSFSKVDQLSAAIVPRSQVTTLQNTAHNQPVVKFQSRFS